MTGSTAFPNRSLVKMGGKKTPKTDQGTLVIINAKKERRFFFK
jgi:hypothetical protein